MEKLNSDMLEMILSQPTKRLHERQTKFLIYQVKKKIIFLFNQKQNTIDVFIRFLLL